MTSSQKRISDASDSDINSKENQRQWCHLWRESATVMSTLLRISDSKSKHIRESATVMSTLLRNSDCKSQHYRESVTVMSTLLRISDNKSQH